MSTPEQFRAAQSAVPARDVMINELRAELAAAVCEARRQREIAADLRRVVAELQRDAAVAPTEAGQDGEVVVFGMRVALDDGAAMRAIFGGVE